jgi:hypothetical protein
LSLSKRRIEGRKTVDVLRYAPSTGSVATQDERIDIEAVEQRIS